MTFLVLPIYNEENNVKTIIPEIRELMAGREYKIVAVNDGSSDGSLDLLNKLKDDDLIIAGSIINMNIGAAFSLAIDTVLNQSNDENDIIVILESDQTSNITLIDDLIAGIEKGNDIVIASRYLNGGGYRNFPLPRLIYSKCANWLMKSFFPIKGATDYTIFLRAYRVKAFYPVVKRLTVDGLLQSLGFVANSELLVKCAVFTDKISEVPFVYDYGRKVGKSKMNVFRTIHEYFVFICYMKYIVNQLKRTLQSC